MKISFKKIFQHLGMTATLLNFSGLAEASDFNLPFVNASELGNVYAGNAAEANDASTGYTNPAGLIRLQQQQFVGALLGLTGDTKYTGTVTNPLLPFAAPFTGTATSSLSAFLPSIYYSIPISNAVIAGFGVTTPFALGTDYGRVSIVRYLSTKSQIVVMNLGPFVGFALTETFSIGAGLDAERMEVTLNNMVGPPFSIPDSESKNTVWGWSGGYHVGVLYQPLPTTRFGLNYKSQVMFHTTGSSQIVMPNAGYYTTNSQKISAALPGIAQLSGYHDFSNYFTAMGTVTYTNWRVLRQITMQNVEFPGGILLPVTIPFNYRDTFDYAVGFNIKPSEKWIFKTGVQWIAAPSNNVNRGVADPIGAATIVGLGFHYQQSPNFSYDFGYEHSFFNQTTIGATGATAALSGHSNTQTNIFGGQINWNIV